MYLILFVLHDPSKMEELLSGWEEEGIERATVLSSTGLGRLRQFKGWRDDLPLIPSLEDFYKAEDHFNRTIFTVVRDLDSAHRLLQVANRVVGDLSQPNTGILLVLPLVEAFGLDKIA